MVLFENPSGAKQSKRCQNGKEYFIRNGEKLGCSQVKSEALNGLSKRRSVCRSAGHRQLGAARNLVYPGADTIREGI